jgi:homocysteine S-methyltransferase
MKSAPLRSRLAEAKPLLLDSAMGTELERRGARSQLPLWSAWALLESPSLVLAIHRDDLEAGADILTANTFRTHRRSLEKAGKRKRAEELTLQAVELARRAAGESSRPILVAGSLSPLEDCYRPDLVPDDGTLWQEHGQQASLLQAAGADLILAETHNTVRELVAAVRAAKETGLPVIASAVTDGQGRLLSGETVEEAAKALAPFRPDALAINCVPAPSLLFRSPGGSPRLPREHRSPRTGISGLPRGRAGRSFRTRSIRGTTPSSPAPGSRSEPGSWAGCCGTTAAHTAALRKLIDSLVTT